jgi:hypothetical protein
MSRRYLSQRVDCKDVYISDVISFSEIGRNVKQTRPLMALHLTTIFVEVTMRPKTLIVPERQRVLAPPFAWVDRRFLLSGFLDVLTPEENLLYFFLVLAADRDGLSFYNYDKICQLLKLEVDEYLHARNTLIDKQLIAFDGRQFQVLALPKSPECPAPSRRRGSSPDQEARVLADVLNRISRGLDQVS